MESYARSYTDGGKYPKHAYRPIEDMDTGCRNPEPASTEYN